MTEFASASDAVTLSDFLRAARGRLKPSNVGLPAPITAPARRVPGLRRDEVAALAGVSVDYYTRMEQGRVPHASDAVISALAAALRLSNTEREYLFSLLASSTGGRALNRKRSTQVRPAIQAILAKLDTTPAFVVGVGMDVLAMNDLAKLLIHDFTASRGLERSLARWTFLSPQARAYYVDWDVVAGDVAASLRRDARNHPNDPGLNELIGELTVKSDEFRKAWAQHHVYECSHGNKRLLHPLVGRLDISYETFPVPGEPDQQLFIYTAPTGSPSADALAILASWETLGVAKTRSQTR